MRSKASTTKGIKGVSTNYIGGVIKRVGVEVSYVQKAKELGSPVTNSIGNVIGKLYIHTKICRKE